MERQDDDDDDEDVIKKQLQYNLVDSGVGYKGVHIFFKNISAKEKVIARLELDFTYYNIEVNKFVATWRWLPHNHHYKPWTVLRCERVINFAVFIA